MHSHSSSPPTRRSANRDTGPRSWFQNTLHAPQQEPSSLRWHYQRRLCQTIALIASAVSVVYALCLWLLFDSYAGALFDFAFAGAHLLAFVPIQFRQYVYATYWTLLLAAAQISVGVLVFVGPETGFQYYLLCLPAVIYLLLYEEPRWRKLMTVSLGMSLLCVSELVHIGTFRINFSALETRVMYFSNLAMVLMLNYLAIKFFADEVREAHSDHKQLVLNDRLTQLANRRYLGLYGERLLALCQRYDRPLCAVLVCLDNLKSINDQRGHEAGDAVLQHLANCLRVHLRAADLAARYDTATFLILLPETSFTSATRFAERLRLEFVTQAALFDGAEIPVQTSVGISTSEENAHASLDELLHSAHEALDKARIASHRS